MPELAAQVLNTRRGDPRSSPEEVAKADTVLYLGRGTGFPVALEGALKLKEISYIHAEGFAAGEMKHGPIALIDKSVPIIVIAPTDRLFEKTVSNMQEVIARGGRIIPGDRRDGRPRSHQQFHGDAHPAEDGLRP